VRSAQLLAGVTLTLAFDTMGKLNVLSYHSLPQLIKLVAAGEAAQQRNDARAPSTTPSSIHIEPDSDTIGKSFIALYYFIYIFILLKTLLLYFIFLTLHTHFLFCNIVKVSDAHDLSDTAPTAIYGIVRLFHCILFFFVVVKNFVVLYSQIFQ
jgi:hypothetical protein